MVAVSAGGSWGRPGAFTKYLLQPVQRGAEGGCISRLCWGIECCVDGLHVSVFCRKMSGFVVFASMSKYSDASAAADGNLWLCASS
jgi:hypothetical protein